MNKIALAAALPALATSASAQLASKAYIGELTGVGRLGLEHSFSKNLRASAAADFTTGEVAGEEGAVRLLSIGLQYDF
jgi:hypothetical protein